jgi:hypothetical protein
VKQNEEQNIYFLSGISNNKSRIDYITFGIKHKLKLS